MRILIVDDEIDIRMVLKKVLRQYGECDEAENGQVAVEKVLASIESGKHYDVMFLDINMPILDGQEALKKIRQLENDREIKFKNQIRIVMLTANSDKGNVFKAFREQCEGYVVKPFEPKDLTVQLEKIGVSVT